MGSAARAIAWELVAKNRWGFAALGLYMLVLVAVRIFASDLITRIEFADAQTFAIIVVVPMTASFLYLIGVFTFGFAGDLAGRESIYPSRLFTLPVTSTALAGWPMLIGTVSVAVLWAGTRILAIWPPGVLVPVIWPGLVGIVMLMWTQALTWMPYGWRGMRVMMALVCLIGIDAAVLLGLEFQVSESFMATLLVPLIPLAFIVARHAVERARHDNAPDWSGIAWSVRSDSATRRAFSSAAEAQAWIEWRRTGLSLPVLVATVVPVELALLFLLGDSEPLTFVTLLGVLVTPPCLAAFTAATVWKSSPDAIDAYRLTPFTAARPLPTTSILAAKLRTTVRSTAVAWLVVAVLVPVFLVWTDTASIVASRWRWMSGGIGMPRAVTIVALALGVAVLSTWKQLVQGLYIGLIGHESLVKASVFVKLSTLFVFLFALNWMLEDGHLFGAVWDSLRWILGALVVVKLAIASAVAIRLFRSGLMSDRTLVGAAALWCGAVFALYGVLVWFLSTPPLFPRYVLMLMAILIMPIARLSATPLALAWNRHQ